MPKDDPYREFEGVDEPPSIERRYHVQAGTLVPLDSAGPARACDVALNTLLTDALPPELHDMIDELVFFSLTASVDYVAEVTSHPDHPSSFRLSLSWDALRDASDVEVLLAHEVAHIVASNGTQLAETDSSECGEIDAGDGMCLRRDAVFSRFLDATWSDRMWDEWDAALGADEDANDQEAVEPFYRGHYGDFVTEYAASDPSEDFAETFSVWCAVPPTDDPRRALGSPALAAAAAKVAWMDTSTIRATLGQTCARLRTLSLSD
jgi:hypothetical protein